MLTVVATLAGLFALWFAFVPGHGRPVDFALAGAAALLATLLGARLGALGASFALAPPALWVERVARTLRGAMSTAGAALSSRADLRPGLARIRTSDASDETRALFADFVGAAPGVVVIEAQADGLLVHALDEDALDAAQLVRVEARLVSALERGS
jgi:multisubunit Na+/H+ antiporter MnhE subunit